MQTRRNLLALVTVGVAFFPAMSAAQVPGGVTTLSGDDIPLRVAAWNLLQTSVSAERRFGYEVEIARLEKNGFDAANAERFLVYAAVAIEELSRFGMLAMDELVCQKRNALSGRDFGLALEERSRRYNDYMAELINGLAAVLDSKSVATFVERARVRNSRMSGFAASPVATFDGATNEQVQAAIARVCDGFEPNP